MANKLYVLKDGPDARLWLRVPAKRRRKAVTDAFRPLLDSDMLSPLVAVITEIEIRQIEGKLPQSKCILSECVVLGMPREQVLLQLMSAVLETLRRGDSLGGAQDEAAEAWASAALTVLHALGEPDAARALAVTDDTDNDNEAGLWIISNYTLAHREVLVPALLAMFNTLDEEVDPYGVVELLSLTRDLRTADVLMEALIQEEDEQLQAVSSGGLSALGAPFVELSLARVSTLEAPKAEIRVLTAAASAGRGGEWPALREALEARATVDPEGVQFALQVLAGLRN